MNLTDEERRHLPGWLLELLDFGHRGEVEYAARHCSTRYYIRLLSKRADELLSSEESAATREPRKEA